MNTALESVVSFKFIAPSNDVIVASLKSAINLDLRMAEMIVAERLSFSEQKEHYLVIDVSKVLSITAEAKKYLQTPEGGLKQILGAALIASTPLAALIANIFIKTPTKFKSRFFSNEPDAITWILTQKEKTEKEPKMIIL
jgi:hypothetical protein